LFFIFFCFFFLGDLPYDWEDVLALIAPRKTLIVSPEFDRNANLKDVKDCKWIFCSFFHLLMEWLGVTTASKAWNDHNASANLTHLMPADISRFQVDQFKAFLDWIG